MRGLGRDDTAAQVQKSQEELPDGEKVVEGDLDKWF
jgi:hypothetical protein